MKKFFRTPIGALAVCMLLLLFPNETLAASWEAMCLWATTFVPALFPFFVVTPALCCPEAAALYERIMGTAANRFFRLPGKTAGAAVIGMMAGSPAGACALRKTCGGLSVGQTTRALLLCSGVSPAFILNALGNAILADPAAGHLILRAQIGSVIISGILLRNAFQNQKELCPDYISHDNSMNPVGGAVLSVMTVCGWMICFSVLSRLLTMPYPPLAVWMLPFLEVSAGCKRIAGLCLPRTMRIVLLAFFAGAGGIAILMQNHTQLPCVSVIHLALGKLLQGVLCAALVYTEIQIPAFSFCSNAPFLSPLMLACICPVVVFFLIMHARNG